MAIDCFWSCGLKSNFSLTILFFINSFLTINRVFSFPRESSLHSSLILWFILPVALSFTTENIPRVAKNPGQPHKPTFPTVSASVRCRRFPCRSNLSRSFLFQRNRSNLSRSFLFKRFRDGKWQTEMAEQRRWQGGRWRRTCSSASGKADHQRRQRKRLTAVVRASLRWDGEDRGRGRQCWQIPSFSLLRLLSFSPTLPLLTLRLWRRRQYDVAGKFRSRFFLV